MGWWDVVMEAGKLMVGAQELWAGTAYWAAVGRHQSTGARRGEMNTACSHFYQRKGKIGEKEQEGYDFARER